MKKKIIITWVLICSLVICAVSAFAQQKLEVMRATKIERDHFVMEYWEGNVQAYYPSGTKAKMTPGYPVFFNKGDYFETIGGHSRTSKTNYGCLVGWNVNKLGLQTNTIFFEVYPQSRIEFGYNEKTKKNIVTLTKGTWGEDKGAKKLDKFDQFMTFISSVDSQKIENQVANWRKSGKFASKDELANHVITQKSTKTGFYGAIAGIGGALSIPNQFLGVLADWVVQAEMAYAIACVYQPKPPSSADFKKDLYMLLCDTDDRNAALRSMGVDVSKEITKSVASEIAGSKMTNIMKDIAERQTNRLAQKAGASGIKAIPILSSFVDAGANFANAKSFGNNAKNYYKK
jgi:hypothetical protein